MSTGTRWLQFIAQIEATDARPSASAGLTFEVAVVSPRPLAWDPHDVWVSRIKRPREAQNLTTRRLPDAQGLLAVSKDHS